MPDSGTPLSKMVKFHAAWLAATTPRLRVRTNSPPHSRPSTVTDISMATISPGPPRATYSPHLAILVHEYRACVHPVAETSLAC